jgi:hypothetical protein
MRNRKGTSAIAFALTLGISYCALGCSAGESGAADESETTSDAISNSNLLEKTAYITLAGRGDTAGSASVGTKKKVAAMLAAIRVGEAVSAADA